MRALCALMAIALMIDASGCRSSETRPQPPPDSGRSSVQTASPPDGGARRGESAPGSSDAGLRPSPVAPATEGSTEPLHARTYAVLVDGNTMVRGGSVGLSVDRVGSEGALSPVGRLVLPGSVSGLAMAGPRLVVAACGGEGVVVADVGDASAPRRVGALRTAGAAWRIEPMGDLLLLAEGHRGVAFVDARDGSHPRVAGRWGSEGFVRHAIAGGEERERRVYAALGRAGVAVLAVPEPTAPRLLGSFDTRGEARALALRGSTLFVADFHEGVAAIDVSVPESPREVGRLATADSARDLALGESLLYVAIGTEGIVVVDASEPSSLAEVSRRPTRAPAVDLVASGDRLYVAADSHGVEVYDISEPREPTRLDPPPETAEGAGDAG